MELCLKASTAEFRLDDARYRVRPASGWSPLNFRVIHSELVRGGGMIWARAEGTRECYEKQVQALLALEDNTQVLMCRAECFSDDLRTRQF